MFIDQRSSGAEASGGGREKPSTVVSAYVGENGVQQVLSLFGDPVWELWPYCQQSNLMPSQKRICWTRIPNGFRDTCKTALYRYWQEGQPGFARPGARTVVQRATQLSVFCQILGRPRHPLTPRRSRYPHRQLHTPPQDSRRRERFDTRRRSDKHRDPVPVRRGACRRPAASSVARLVSRGYGRLDWPLGPQGW